MMPLAGGALTTGLSWRWVFLINVPIGAALIALAATALSGARPAQREPLDLAGALTGTAGLAALVYGVMQTATHAWTSALVAGPVAAGLLLLAAFAAVEARLAAHPMLPRRLLRRPRPAVYAAMLLFGGISMAMWYFTSLLLQNVLGYSALAAGLGQTPAAVAFVVVARVATGRLPRTGPRPPILAGCAALLTGFAWLAAADPGAGYLTAVLGPTLLVAAGIGLTFPTLMAAATTGVAEGDAGVAGALATTASQVGGSVALAVFATLPGYDEVFVAAAVIAAAIALLAVAARPASSPAAAPSDVDAGRVPAA